MSASALAATSRAACVSTVTCGLRRRIAAADLGRAVDDLALQVRERDRVVVDDAERADPGRGEIEQRRRAQPAGPDDQHTRALERLLPRPADLVQDDVAGIAFKLLRTEHRMVPRRSTPSSAKATALPRATIG